MAADAGWIWSLLETASDLWDGFHQDRSALLVDSPAAHVGEVTDRSVRKRLQDRLVVRSLSSQQCEDQLGRVARLVVSQETIQRRLRLGLRFSRPLPDGDEDRTLGTRVKDGTVCHLLWRATPAPGHRKHHYQPNPQSTHRVLYAPPPRRLPA